MKFKLVRSAENPERYFLKIGGRPFAGLRWVPKGVTFFWLSCTRDDREELGEWVDYTSFRECYRAARRAVMICIIADDLRDEARNAIRTS